MPEWTLKVDHLNYVKQISKGKNFKIVLLYTGAFLEIVFQVRASYTVICTLHQRTHFISLLYLSHCVSLL